MSELITLIAAKHTAQQALAQLPPYVCEPPQHRPPPANIFLASDGMAATAITTATFLAWPLAL